MQRGWMSACDFVSSHSRTYLPSFPSLQKNTHTHTHTHSLQAIGASPPFLPVGPNSAIGQFPHPPELCSYIHTASADWPGMGGANLPPGAFAVAGLALPYAASRAFLEAAVGATGADG